jgi:hypothetical protein
MSKAYKVDMNIDVSKSTPNGGFLIYRVEKEVDARGFKERSGAEVFAYLGMAAIGGANPKCSYDQLKNFRRVSTALQKASEKGEFIGNKTDLEIIKQSIRGNQNWPNTDEMFAILEQIIAKIDAAVEVIENPSAV